MASPLAGAGNLGGPAPLRRLRAHECAPPARPAREEGDQFGPGVCRRATQLGTVRHYDVVYIHRGLSILGPAVLERVLPLFGKPVIFDFDDAIFLRHTTRANRHFGWLKFPGKTAAICRTSAHVVVGNVWLADYARRSNSRVTVIPSSVDTRRFQPVRKDERKSPDRRGLDRQYDFSDSPGNVRPRAGAVAPDA